MTTFSGIDLTGDCDEYLRVSVNRHENDRSQDEQHDENTGARAEWGLTLRRTYRDTAGASRQSKGTRDDFLRLLEDLAAPSMFARGDVLHLWESSRGSRKVGEWVTMLDLAEERGVLFLVTTHGRMYNPANARDRRSLLEDAVDSEYESGKISYRAVRDAAANAIKGKPHGQCPYGYERVYDPLTKKFVEQRVVAGEAKVVEEIFTRLAKGVSKNKVTADLNARNLTSTTPAKLAHINAKRAKAGLELSTGTPWTPQRVGDVATNPVYVGKRSHKGIITEGCWPAIVKDSTYAKVQRIFSDPTRRTTKEGKIRHMCSSGATRCGICVDGGWPTSIISLANHRNQQESPAYFCRDRSHTTINQKALDDYVTKAILLRLLEHGQDYANVESANDAEVMRLRAEAEQLRTRKAEVAREFTKGRISIETLVGIDEQLSADLQVATRAEQNATVSPVLRFLTVDDEDESATDDDVDEYTLLAQRWLKAPVTARRAVIKYLADIRIYRRPANAGRRITDPSERVVIDWKK